MCVCVHVKPRGKRSDVLWGLAVRATSRLGKLLLLFRVCVYVGMWVCMYVCLCVLYEGHRERDWIMLWGLAVRVTSRLGKLLLGLNLYVCVYVCEATGKEIGSCCGASP